MPKIKILLNYILSLYKGRIGRIAWLIGLVVLFLSFIALFSFSLSIASFLPQYFAYFSLGLSMILSFYFAYSLHVRRFHDMGWNGWSALLGFIPLIGILIFLFLIIGEGNSGPNKYGEPNNQKNPLKSIFRLG